MEREGGERAVMRGGGRHREKKARGGAEREERLRPNPITSLCPNPHPYPLILPLANSSPTKRDNPSRPSYVIRSRQRYVRNRSKVCCWLFWVSASASSLVILLAWVLDIFLLSEKCGKDNLLIYFITCSTPYSLTGDAVISIWGM